MVSEGKIFSRFGNGKKLVLKEIAKDGAKPTIHQKDDSKGNFRKNQRETDAGRQLGYKDMKRKGLR